jgi:hypothetical protein
MRTGKPSLERLATVAELAAGLAERALTEMMLRHPVLELFPIM